MAGIQKGDIRRATTLVFYEHRIQLHRVGGTADFRKRKQLTLDLPASDVFLPNLRSNNSRVIVGEDKGTRSCMHGLSHRLQNQAL